MQSLMKMVVQNLEKDAAFLMFYAAKFTRDLEGQCLRMLRYLCVVYDCAEKDLSKGY